MKFFVIGTRGIPHIPGGVEKHCEELYPRLVELGHEVFLSTRFSYVKEKISQWKGVNLIHCYAPKHKSLEAIIHTFLSLLKAYVIKPDIVHIHAVGPALLVPFAKLLGLKVIFTNHGPDYDRQKWGWLAKLVLRIGEMYGCLFADKTIAISKVISSELNRKYGIHTVLIPNGVTCQSQSEATYFLEKSGIMRGKYILSVARFVPEKGLDILIDAFLKVDTELQLVIAGDSDHESDYSLKIKDIASKNCRIILTGYITGEDLRQVFSHAKLFVLPSYHEGLPIALLEAMSYGRKVLVSNIPAHLEMNLPGECYFNCGDAENLSVCIKNCLKMHDSSDTGLSENNILQSRDNAMIALVKKRYNWEEVALKTLELYKTV